MSTHPDPKQNFFQAVMKDVELPFVTGRTQTSLMALLQRLIHEQLCRLPALPASPFLTTLHARFRTFEACQEEFQSLHRTSPTLDVLRRIARLEHPHQLADILSTLHQYGCHVLFNVQYDPDLRRPEQNILYFRVGEPVGESPTPQRQQQYLAALFAAFRQPPPTTDVWHTEQQLFARRPTTYELQSTACFNPVSEEDWHGDLTWLKFYSLPRRWQYVSLDSLAFFRHIGALLTTLPLPAWRDYLTFRWLHTVSDLYADTYPLIYQFAPDPVQPDADLCRAETVCKAWWQDAGYQFVQADSVHLHKARRVVQSLVADMKDTFRAILEHTRWQPATRQEALRKLENMEVLVGWPDAGTGALVVKPSPVLPSDLTLDEGVFRGHQYQYEHILEQADSAVDRQRWRWESCTVVNAFYSREANVVYLPAALFYPPFVFLEERKMLAHYCAMGCIVAHEMMHALDYDSRHVDGNGLLRRWWHPDDEHHYIAAVKATLQLYQRHQPGSSRNTLSENMADLMGLRLVWQTFLLRWKFTYDREPTADEAREFFRIYVISQAQLYRPRTQQAARHSDLHALAETRINVPLSTFPPFLELYGVRRSDAMYTPVAERPDFWPIKRH